MTVYLGIDIASKKFDVASLCDGNYRCKAFENTSAGFLALYKWLGQSTMPDIHACQEATGDYGTSLATFLYENKIKVSVVNPARIKGFGASELSRTKTDKADSKLIARFCKAAVPDGWKPTPAPVRKLQALVRRISALNGMLRMECNRRENADTNIQASLDRIISLLKTEIEVVRQEIKDHVRSDDELKKQDALIQSVPGIGAVSSNLILSFMSGKGFRKAKEVTAYLGLNPRHHQSGSSVRGKTRMSKMGDARLRSALYMPALVALPRYKGIRATSVACRQTENACRRSRYAETNPYSLRGTKVRYSVQFTHSCTFCSYKLTTVNWQILDRFKCACSHLANGQLCARNGH